MIRKSKAIDKIGSILLVCFMIELMLGTFLSGIVNATSTPITNFEKQQLILNWVDEHRNDGGNLWPPELIIAMIRQEGGEGAFHTSGDYYPYNNYKYGAWTEPDNTWQDRKDKGYDFYSDGIMQVTPASDFAGSSGYSQKNGGVNSQKNGGVNSQKNGGVNSIFLYLI